MRFLVPRLALILTFINIRNSGQISPSVVLGIQASSLVSQGTAGKIQKTAIETLNLGRHLDFLTSFGCFALIEDRDRPQFELSCTTIVNSTMTTCDQI